MFTKTLFFILLVSVSFSCRYAGETVVNSQSSVETNVNIQTVGESNGNTSQAIDNDSLIETDAKTFAKTFIVTGKFSDSKKTTVYSNHMVEFEDELKGISIYVDKRKKASLKFETNRPEVRANFLESNGERLFVLVIGSSGFGTCGDSTFAIAKMSENLDIKLSERNEPECQGEFYPIKIENVGKSNKFHRQISIGKLKFNADSFEWKKEK